MFSVSEQAGKTETEAVQGRTRPAARKDVGPIAALLSEAAEKGLVLPRTEREIIENLDNFLVFELAEETVGCVALRDFGEGLFEVRSLVVREDVSGRRIGSRLVKDVVETVRLREGNEIFSLTYRPGLFQRQGFNLVDKNRFPQKVWSDCSICRKRDNCDEIAMLLRLEHS